MITKTVRQFTYEDVRLALSSYFQTEVPGVRVTQDLGFLVQECRHTQQPWSAVPVEAGPISTRDMHTAGDWLKNPLIKALGDDDPLLPHNPGLTGEPERRGK